MDEILMLLMFADYLVIRSLTHSLSNSVECDHREALTDLAGSQPPLDFCDGATEHISAAFFNHEGTLLAPIELNELPGRVDHVGSEVMFHIRLLFCLIALTLCSLLTVHVLELCEVF